MRNRQDQPVGKVSKTIGIAKMDARKPGTGRLDGQYWLVPMIAKMDVVKIFITAIPGSYP